MQDEPQYPPRCPTCREPYSVPATRRSLICMDTFRVCRDCVFRGGRILIRCLRCQPRGRR